MKKLLLAGDSICKRYRYVVIDKLKGKAELSIINDKEYSDNGGRSVYILKNWNKWVKAAKPNIMHWNAGLHDLKIWKEPKRQGHCCKLSQFQKNIMEVIRRCKTEDIFLIWATITPLRGDTQETDTYIRKMTDIDAYNKAALEIVDSENIPVNDLHKVIIENSRENCISKDGVHQSSFGNDILGEKVVEFLEKFL